MAQSLRWRLLFQKWSHKTRTMKRTRQKNQQWIWLQSLALHPEGVILGVGGDWQWLIPTGVWGGDWGSVSKEWSLCPTAYTLFTSVFSPWGCTCQLINSRLLGGGPTWSQVGGHWPCPSCVKNQIHRYIESNYSCTTAEYWWTTSDSKQQKD